MSNKSNQAKATNKPAVDTVAPVVEAQATPATPASSTEESVTPSTVVVETPAVPATQAPVAAAAAPAAPAKVLTRLFWQKTCHSIKESTNTEVKPNEVFVKTPHQVQIPNPDATQAAATPYVTVPVYSLKRGKRIYYTPYVSPEQAAAAEVLATSKATEKAEKEAAKKAEKEAKEAEKAAKKATQAAAVQPAAVAQPAAAPVAPAATMKEEEMPA
jgi:hypothetical protein